MKRAAVFAFDDACRLVLERDTTTPGMVDEYRGTAAWLMCNPSRASHEIDDPTALRVVHHSLRNGCARSLVGNVWCLRTPYPAELFGALAMANGYPREMDAANLDALAMIGAQADVLVVAFGAAPGRSYRPAVERALDAFRMGSDKPLMCLGTTADGWPLHPLARGKLAVRNDTPLREWSVPA